MLQLGLMTYYSGLFTIEVALTHAAVYKVKAGSTFNAHGPSETPASAAMHAGCLESAVAGVDCIAGCNRNAVGTAKGQRQTAFPPTICIQWSTTKQIAIRQTGAVSLASNCNWESL